MADSEFSLAALFASTHEDLPDAQPNIITVCTGNICRSPLAETVLATRLADLDIRVVTTTTGELLRHLTLDPNRLYQPLGAGNRP